MTIGDYYTPCLLGIIPIDWGLNPVLNQYFMEWLNAGFEHGSDEQKFSKSSLMVVHQGKDIPIHSS